MSPISNQVECIRPLQPSLTICFMVLEGFYTLFNHFSDVQLLIHVCKTDSSWIQYLAYLCSITFFCSRLFCYEIVLNLIVSFDVQTFSPAELALSCLVPLFCHTCLYWFFWVLPKILDIKRFWSHFILTFLQSNIILKW